MNRMMYRWAVLAAVVLLSHAAGGCATTYDGSSAFYEQHPEYQSQPAYMHGTDADSATDPRGNRPW